MYKVLLVEQQHICRTLEALVDWEALGFDTVSCAESFPEALDKACFILAGIDEKGLLQAVDTAVQMNLDGNDGIPVPDYVEENVSTKVVKLIQSYTGVVDKMVWRKY